MEILWLLQFYTWGSDEQKSEVLWGFPSVAEIHTQAVQLRACVLRDRTRNVGGKRQEGQGIRLEFWDYCLHWLGLVNISKAFLSPVTGHSMIPMTSSSLEKDLFFFILTDILFYWGQRSVFLLTSHPLFLFSLKYIQCFNIHKILLYLFLHFVSTTTWQLLLFLFSR